ncbi:hypothetical protein P1J78_12570 [Psychromarinibacter sp. C21-152]|uniref:Uncharacterized protein n=1 Tax=Psychromarinibacter sediminicola TaxID=3033385 RepID=A0AAE3NT43_9RHOB|nr:hypothetical protein [Psychromarinibacter sediminicola]MDF0601571.1 hypothetical protein [Psychromarinibacter sediminicola]
MRDSLRQDPQDSPLDDDLRLWLDGIRAEATPEGLTDLARRLQDLLRQRDETG